MDRADLDIVFKQIDIKVLNGELKNKVNRILEKQIELYLHNYLYVWGDYLSEFYK